MDRRSDSGNGNRPSDAAAAADKGPLEKVLSVFADVRRGEAATALLLALNVFILLSAYYLLKVTREPLILQSGAALKVYASAVMAVLLVPLLKGFELISERVDRIKLIATTTAFFVVCLLAFSTLVGANVAIGFPFFIWVGIFNTFVIAQFWAFATDIYTERQGRRLFPIVAIGSAAGAIAGSKFAGVFFDPHHLGRLMLVAAALLVVSLGLTFFVHRREDAASTAQEGPRPSRESIGKGGGFRMMMKDKYLVLIAILAIVYNCVNTIGEYVLDRGIIAAAHGSAAQISAFQAQFRSNFFTVVNIAGLALQLFAVSRVLKYLGVRIALFVMPVISLLGYSSIAVFASLGVMFWAKAAENSADYSIQNTTRQALFLITRRDVKYKVKALIDTFFVRLGDVVAAILVWLGSGPLHLATRGFVLMNIVLVVSWLFIAWRLGRVYGERSEEPRDSRNPAAPAAARPASSIGGPATART